MQSTLVSNIKVVYSNVAMENFDEDHAALEASDRDATAILHSSSVGL